MEGKLVVWKTRLLNVGFSCGEVAQPCRNSLQSLLKCLLSQVRIPQGPEPLKEPEKDKLMTKVVSVCACACTIRQKQSSLGKMTDYSRYAPGFCSCCMEDGTEGTQVWLVGSHFTNSLFKGGSTRVKPTCCTESVKERVEEFFFFFLSFSPFE